MSKNPSARSHALNRPNVRKGLLAASLDFLHSSFKKLFSFAQWRKRYIRLLDGAEASEDDPIALSTTLLLRFYDSGDSAHLESAIQIIRDERISKPADVALIIRLSICLISRYESAGASADIDEALLLLRAALEAAGAPQGPPNENQISLAQWLATALQTRFERTGAVEDLEAAITTMCGVADLIPDSHPQSPPLLFFLGGAFQQRFERFHRLEDLDTAISIFRRALPHMPKKKFRMLLLQALGDVLSSRAKQVGKLEDFEASVSAFREAADLAPRDHRASSLICLGNALDDRFEYLGQLEDIEAAISAKRRATELTPDDHQDKPGYLQSLSNSLRCRFQRTKDLVDLEAATATMRAADNLTPDDHPSKHWRLIGLGMGFKCSFNLTEKLEDLEAAITAQRTAVDLLRDDHPDKPHHLSTLGISLLARYVYTEAIDDLEAATRLLQRSVDLTPDGHPEKPASLNPLADCLRDRFEHFGELQVIETAILTQRSSLELTPDGHWDKPCSLAHLGLSFWVRYERIGELNDLEDALSNFRAAAELSRDNDSDKAMWVSNVGSALQIRFHRVGDLQDLNAAISQQRSALDRLPADHRGIPSRMSNLGLALRSRFECVGADEDIEAAIAAQRSAIELIGDGHSDKPLLLLNLGVSLKSRFERAASQSHFDAFVECLMDAAMQACGSPSTRLDAARYCIDFMNERPEFCSPGSLLLAHSHVMRIIPEVVSLHLRLQRLPIQFLKKLAGYVRQAVSVAIAHSQLGQVLEWLEVGSSLSVASSLPSKDLRNSLLDELDTQHPELSKRFRDAQGQLQTSVYYAHYLESQSDEKSHIMKGFMESSAATARIHRLFTEYDRVLEGVRGQSGFENFLRPAGISSLLPPEALGDGYVVFINVHQSRCDALITTSSGTITSVALPELSEDRVLQLHSQWTKGLQRRGVGERGDGDGDLSRMLESLWGWIVHPVLLSMKIVDKAPMNLLPRITWCTSGPLAQLPLHAAGVYNDPNGPCLFNYAVSSYTPSLSALLRRNKSLSAQRSIPSVLIITHHQTPEKSSSVETSDECKQLPKTFEEARIPYKTIAHDHSAVAAVRAIIDRPPWVHVAGHGSQSVGDATQIKGHLDDVPLSLSDLMKSSAESAELLFLSTCQMVTGDKTDSEEFVQPAADMLEAGFKGVIAPMWSTEDTDARVVVDGYYKKLLKLREAGAVGKGQTGAAYALHEAVGVLREQVGERNFLGWAPFAHFGA